MDYIRIPYLLIGAAAVAGNLYISWCLARAKTDIEVLREGFRVVAVILLTMLIVMGLK